MNLTKCTITGLQIALKSTTSQGDRRRSPTEWIQMGFCYKSLPGGGEDRRKLKRNLENLRQSRGTIALLGFPVMCLNRFQQGLKAGTERINR